MTSTAVAEAQPGQGNWFARTAAAYAAFLPALLLLGFFFVVPLVIIVLYSFWEVVDYNVVHNWTTGNYTYFFSVSTYVQTMWATLWVATLATAIVIVLAFPFSYWLSRYVPRRWRMLLLVLVVVPFWTSYLLRVYSWLTILGDKGVLNRFLEWTGLTSQPVGLFLYDRPAVILVLVYLYFPFAALTLYASIERFDWDAAARCDGPGGTAADRDPPDPDPAGAPRNRDGDHLRLHPDPRRVPDASDHRRHRRRDDRKSRRELLPGGGVHPGSRGVAPDCALHPGAAVHLPEVVVGTRGVWRLISSSSPPERG